MRVVEVKSWQGERGGGGGGGEPVLRLRIGHGRGAARPPTAPGPAQLRQGSGLPLYAHLSPQPINWEGLQGSLGGGSCENIPETDQRVGQSSTAVCTPHSRRVRCLSSERKALSHIVHVGELNRSLEVLQKTAISKLITASKQHVRCLVSEKLDTNAIAFCLQCDAAFKVGPAPNVHWWDVLRAVN